MLQSYYDLGLHWEKEEENHHPIINLHRLDTQVNLSICYSRDPRIVSFKPYLSYSICQSHAIILQVKTFSVMKVMLFLFI